MSSNAATADSSKWSSIVSPSIYISVKEFLNSSENHHWGLKVWALLDLHDKVAESKPHRLHSWNILDKKLLGDAFRCQDIVHFCHGS
jgi:hypothetical protein